MQTMGFDGYALDYVDYPEGMRWFLMRDVNLHRAVITNLFSTSINSDRSSSPQAIALNGGKIDVNKTMQMVARPSDKHPGGASFVNGHTMNIVTRSRYGRKAIGNVTETYFRPKI
jgi:hypothetical protein